MDDAGGMDRDQCFSKCLRKPQNLNKRQRPPTETRFKGFAVEELENKKRGAVGEAPVIDDLDDVRMPGEAERFGFAAETVGGKAVVSRCNTQQFQGNRSVIGDAYPAMNDATGAAREARTDPVEPGDSRPFEVAEGPLDRLGYEGDAGSRSFFLWFLRAIPKHKLALEGLPSERLLTARAPFRVAVAIEEREGDPHRKSKCKYGKMSRDRDEGQRQTCANHTDRARDRRGEAEGLPFTDRLRGEEGRHPPEKCLTKRWLGRVGV